LFTFSEGVINRRVKYTKEDLVMEEFEIDSEKLYSVKEVVDLLGIKLGTVNNWIYMGKLKRVKTLRGYRVLGSDLKSFVVMKLS